ncbi:uncharacterized protein LOC119162457 isoform X2 [Rhipicephalus microplus]|uniref:uncharacterized protein LOC119162457 isoform X2 n=1 Tax=Rhipicephalus microplus TaxID=6941 RepID=UPI003F6B93BF
MPTALPFHHVNSFGDENPFDSSHHRYRPLVLVLLLPVYLCPMLLQDSQGWKTVFCIALTLSLLLSDEFPSMAAAFLPLVLAPLLGLADAQTLVPHYMDGTVLSLACAQCLVGVLASDSNIVARISCALFGMLGIRYLGMGFVAASLLAGSILPASHPVLLLAVRLVERVVGDLEADALDAQRRGDGWFDYSHAAPRTTRALSTDDLFDQLASTVVSLPAKKASTSRRKFGRFHDTTPDEDTLLSGQSIAPRRRPSKMRRSLSRMLSFSGAAQAGHKSRTKSICLPKLRPVEAPPACMIPHRVPFTRRLTTYDVTERHAAGPRQRRLTLGTAAAAAEPGSLVSSRHLAAAPLSRRLSQAVGRFVKPAPAQDAAMSTAATATVAAEATMEAGKPEGDESFHLQGKTSPKPALKNSRRKSMAAKRASLAEPSHLGITSNSDEPPLYPRPQPPSAIKRRQSIAPPRSSTPVTSVSDYSTSHTVPAIKWLQTDKVASVLPQVLADAAASTEASSTPVHRSAQQCDMSKLAEGEATGPVLVQPSPWALDSDRDFMRKPSIQKPGRFSSDGTSKTLENEDGAAREPMQPQQHLVEVDIPTSASQASDLKTSEPMATRPRMISIAPQVQLVQWEGAPYGDVSSNLSYEEEKQAEKIRW